MEIVTKRSLQRMEIPKRSDAFEAWLSQSSQVSLLKNSKDVSGHLDYKKAECFLFHLQFQFMPARHSNYKQGNLFQIRDVTPVTDARPTRGHISSRMAYSVRFTCIILVVLQHKSSCARVLYHLGWDPDSILVAVLVSSYFQLDLFRSIVFEGSYMVVHHKGFSIEI